MSERISAYLGLPAHLLPLREQQMKLIASNLANIDTPGYHAQTLDFAAALQQAGYANDSLRATDTQHFRHTYSDAEATIINRPVALANLDGNTVDPDTERAAYGRAALEYRASLNFIEHRAQQLSTAITGQ